MNASPRAGKLCPSVGGARRVEFEHLFSGSALTAVDAKGRLSVPAFIRAVVERRGGSKEILIGLQEGACCLKAFDQTYLVALNRENERRRLAEETGGGTLVTHHQRQRRDFGYAEPAPYDTSGRIILPARLRRRGRIEGLALFVGIGPSFEIWNPKLAIESGDPDLADLAADLIEDKGIAL